MCSELGCWTLCTLTYGLLALVPVRDAEVVLLVANGERTRDENAAGAIPAAARDVPRYPLRSLARDVCIDLKTSRIAPLRC
jgi:hypothetical protein